MGRRLHAVAALGLLSVLLAASAALAQGPANAPIHTAFYLHRDATLSLELPTSDADAVLAFGPTTPHEATFQSLPFNRSLTLRAPATLQLTFDMEVSVLGRLTAVLAREGQPFATSDAADFLVDGRQKDVSLTFPALDATFAPGEVFELTLRLDSAVDLASSAATDLKVDLLYDSTAHPGGLHLPDASPAVPVSLGPNGTGEDLDRTGGPSPPSILGTGAPVPESVVLMGVATAMTGVVAALRLRGR